MQHLPPDFADELARVLEPGHGDAAAEIIQAAAALDDDGLRKFLELFAERVRSSAAPVRPDELERFLRTSTKGGHAAAP
jgi:hypothetical protein